MSDSDDQRRSRYRRVSGRDRKDKLEGGKLEFPPDEPGAESAEHSRFAPPESVDEERELDVEPDAPVGPQQTYADADRFPPLKPPPEPTPQAAAAGGAPPRRRSRFGWQDVIALLFLAATAGVIWWGAQIIEDHYSPLNPLPPFTPPPRIVSETPAPAQPTTVTPFGAGTTLDEESLLAESPMPGPFATATFTPLPPEALTALAVTPPVAPPPATAAP